MMSGAAEGATTAIITAAITGAFVGITALALTYSHHKEAVHLARIRVINDLHVKYLANVKLPPIFEMKKDDKMGEVAVSLTMPQKVFDDIAQATPAYSDADLILYGDLILDALARTRKFYQFRLNRTKFKKGSPEDDTSSVLCYVMLMLSAHCIKFSDYDVTLRTLLALRDFVHAFASIGNDVKRARFQFLRPVEVVLKKAHDHLKDHFLSMSLSEKLDLSIHNLADINKKYLRSLLKLIVSKDDWMNVDWLMPQQISEGILKYKYEDASWFAKEDIHFKKSILSEYIIRCSQHYEHAIKRNDEGGFIKKENFPPFPVATENDIKALRKAFKESNNFLTYKVNLDNSTDETVIETANNLLDLISLMGMLNDGLFFATLMELKVDTFGKVYMDDPHHCEFLFRMIHLFAAKQQQKSSMIFTKIDQINTANEGNILEEGQAVYSEFFTLFERINTGKIVNAQAGEATQMSVHDYFIFLTDVHNNRVEVRQIEKKKLRGEVMVSKDQLLMVAFIMSDVYDLDTGFKPVIDSSTTNTPLVAAAIEEWKKNRLSRRGSTLKIVQTEPEAQESPERLLKDNEQEALYNNTHEIPQPVLRTPSTIPVTTTGVTTTIPSAKPTVVAKPEPPTIPVPSSEPIVPVIPPIPPPAQPLKVKPEKSAVPAAPAPPVTTLEILNAIEKKNNELRGHNGDHVKIYDEMYCELLKINLHLKIMRYLDESSQRQDKADQSLNLLNVICKRTLAFLNGGRTVNDAGGFAADIRNDLMGEAPHFLDRHKPLSVKKMMCMPTETRNLMTEFQNLCDKLTAHGLRHVV